MIKIFFKDNNSSIFKSRVDYVLNFIENHPLIEKRLKFTRDSGHQFDIACNYGISNSGGFFIPSQGVIFSENAHHNFGSLVANPYTYQSLNLYSVSSKKEGSNTLVTDKQFQFDIIETIFFHISRMEEWFCEANQLDPWDMMQSKEQFLVKHDLHHFPVVDHLIFAFANALGLALTPQKTQFRVTHDIDQVFRSASLFSTIRATGGILWRRQKPSAIRKVWSTYLSKQNEFNTFSWMLLQDPKIEKCIYFLAGGTTKYDSPYPLATDEMKTIFQLCKERNYRIGIHPSYDAWRDKTLFKREKEKLEQQINSSIEISRQHYLHWDFEKTPNLLMENNIKEDSTIGFRDEVGFRCGTGFGYHLYNFKKEEPFNFIEVPLIVMDSSLFKNTNHDLIKAREVWVSFLAKNKIHTKITFNFHNSRFFDASIHGIPLKKWYQELFPSQLNSDEHSTTHL